MKPADFVKKYVLPNLPYLIFLWFFAKFGEAVRLAPGVDASTKLLGLADGFTLAFQTSMPGAAVDWLIGLIGAAVVRLAARRDTVLVTHDEHAADLLGWPVVRLETVGK